MLRLFSILVIFVHSQVQAPGESSRRGLGSHSRTGGNKLLVGERTGTIPQITSYIIGLKWFLLLAADSIRVYVCGEMHV